MLLSILNSSGTNRLTLLGTDIMSTIASTILASSVAPETLSTQWRALCVFSVYRISLAFLLLLGVSFYPHLFFLSPSFAQPFTTCTEIYLVIGIVLCVGTFWRVFNFEQQVLAQCYTDILLLTGMIFFSQGLSVGFGVVMITAIAGSSSLLSGRLSLFFAAFATIMLFLQQTLKTFYYDFSLQGFVLVAFYGACFFTTACIIRYLSNQIQRSDAIASQRQIDLNNLGELNSQVVQRLQSGIMIIDKSNKVPLSNFASQRLLGLKKGGSVALRLKALDLLHCLKTCREACKPIIKTIRHEEFDTEVMIQFMPIGSEQQGVVLVFLDEMTQITKKAQQMKVASLGRFTAGLAHELRNPLGAVSHASQLLIESKNITKEEKRLVNIVKNQSERMNEIIKNIMQLSRDREQIKSKVNIKAWVKEFVQEFKSINREHYQISVSLPPHPLFVSMDKTQLYQVLTNLCENGLRFSKESTWEYTLVIKVYQNKFDDTVIDIIDDGPGVAKEDIPKLFEPFFTTRRSGTGLGLFIARELSEANHVRLDYHKFTNGSCFRLTFPSVERFE